MPRRHTGDIARWWSARPAFVIAFVTAPAVWLAAVNGAVSMLERRAQLERDVAALQKSVERIDVELRELRRR